MSGRVRDPIGRAGIYAASFAAGLFLIIGLFKVGGLVQSIYQTPDHASPPVIAQLFGSRGSGEVTLGNYPWLESLFLERWTRNLPHHRTVWEAWPFVLYLATLTLVGWTVARATSARLGLLVALALAVPAQPVIWTLGAPASHGPTLAHTVLLSALLITLPRVARARHAWRAAWTLGLALSLAPGVASDPVLMLVWGVIPFLAAVALAWRTGIVRTGPAALAALSAFAGTALGFLLEKIAEHHHIVYFQIEVHRASITKLATNARLLLEDVALFVHGRFEDPFLSTNGIESVVGALAMVGIPLLCVLIARTLPGLIASRALSREATLLAGFWATALVGMSAVFLVPIAGIVGDIGSLRYLTVLWPALLVLVAVTWGARAVPWLAVLVLATAALGCLELLRGDYDEQEPWLTDQGVAAVTRFVEENDLSHGYANYEHAAPLTWESDFRVKSYPVNMCGSPVPLPLRCQFHLHTMDSWYVPMPNVRTFYIWDDRSLDASIAPPPRRWGPPFATAVFGHLHIYAYDYDLASVLGRYAA